MKNDDSVARLMRVYHLKGSLRLMQQRADARILLGQLQYASKERIYELWRKHQITYDHVRAHRLLFPRSHNVIF